jgi:hypothetical protein
MTAPVAVPFTFSVGDYVWVRLRAGGRRWLGCVQSAIPVRGRYLVRIRDRVRWEQAVHLPIEAPLFPHEIAHNRKLGLIPELGQALS